VNINDEGLSCPNLSPDGVRKLPRCLFLLVHVEDSKLSPRGRKMN
jgi:hypothetical protein